VPYAGCEFTKRAGDWTSACWEMGLEVSLRLARTWLIPLMVSCSLGCGGSSGSHSDDLGGGGGSSGAGGGSSGAGGGSSSAGGGGSSNAGGGGGSNAGGGGSSAGGGGSSGGGGIAGDTTPMGAPTWSTQFVTADSALFTTKDSAASQITFGLASSSAVDQLAGQLVFPGSTTFGANDHAGTDFATEIDAKATNFQYGQYRSRVRLAACASTEDVVNGNFTYFNDGTDHDGDGLVDNSELDIEILCGTPSVLSLTIWSQYTDDNGFKKWTRAVDLEKGSYQESTADNVYDLGNSISEPTFKHPGFFDPNAFYEMGFEWHSDSIRYFIVLDNQELTLWTFTNKALIPQLATQWLFNVWHPSTHWFGTGGAASYPAKDATMQIDWARYWKTAT
jgi:hypothetical protein